MSRENYNEENLCPKCKAPIGYRSVPAKGLCRKVTEGQCVLCGTRVYPQADDSRRLVLLDLSEEDEIWTRLTKLVQENSSSYDVEMLSCLDVFFEYLEEEVRRRAEHS